MSASEKIDLDSIGQHCAFLACNRLDFLPVKCDYCRICYCIQHYR